MDARKAGGRPIPYTIYSDRGVAHLNTRIAGVRHRPSLHLPYEPGVTRGAALRAIEEAAAREYGRLIAGRVLDPGPEDRLMTTSTLQELGDAWLEEAEVLWPKSIDTRTTQFGNVADWAITAPRFASDKRTPLERLVDDAGPAQFGVDRLGQVLRDTVTKEMTNLYAFFTWALREKHIASIPPRPKLPAGVKGVRVGPQRDEPVDITFEEAIAVCEAMPEYTRRGGRGIKPGAPRPLDAIVVRDVYRLAWELGLRPGDVQTLAVPRHWRPGQGYVRFSDDKTESNDRIPLTQVALEILERHAPASGVIFGKHDLRVQVKRAAEKVFGEGERAERFAAYDFRHGRINHALDLTQNLKGVGGMVRHRRLTTTLNHYVRSRPRDVASVVAQLDAENDRVGAVSTRSASPIPSPQNCAGFLTEAGDIVHGVRRKGLEPLRCYPLAPQRTADECFPGFSVHPERHLTPPDANGSAADAVGWSGDGQQAFSRLRRALAAEQSQWAQFDAFTDACLGTVCHSVVQ